MKHTLSVGQRAISNQPARPLPGAKKELIAYLFLLPAIVAFLVFKYYPILQGIFISFFNINIVKFPGDFCGLDNYIRAFRDPAFYRAIGNNLTFLLYGIVMNFWPPIVVAVLINEVRIKKTFFRMIYFIPTVAPAIATSVLWKYIWQPDYGFANYLIKAIGLPGQMWLNDTRLVYFCMAFPGMIIAGGMSMLIYLAALQNIPEEHFEASMLEGAGFLYRIRYIALPQMKTVVSMMFVLMLIGTFNNYETPLLMTDGGPLGATQTIILYAYNKAMNQQDYSYAITIANLTFFLVFGLTALQMKWSARKEN